MKRTINHLGFSLLEILITLSLISVLCLLGNAAYSHFTTRVHRLAAAHTLMRAAATLERYALMNGTYEGISLNLPQNQPGYAFKASITASTYTITAYPNAANHDPCGRLSINENHDTLSDEGSSSCFAT